MGEAKIFESGSFVVTTERFIYGSKIYYLDDIDTALPMTYIPWGGIVSLAIFGFLGLLIALLMFMGSAAPCGIFLILICSLMFFAVYYLIAHPDRSVIFRASGELESIKIESPELCANLANAINKGISDRKMAQFDALHDEISNLPRA